jgi:uncharacterized protein DUF6194
VTEDAITQFVIDTFTGVDVVIASQEAESPKISWGDRFFFYDPNRDLAPNRKFPFATIVTKDYGDFDRASNLNRPGVFRLNISVGKETYRSLFGFQPAAAEIAKGHDFTALDQLMPHPVYAAQAWICILNPSDSTFQTRVRPFLAEAYERAVRKPPKSKEETIKKA